MIKKRTRIKMVLLEKLSVFEKIIGYLSYELNNKPTMYGWFHLLFLGLFTFSTIIISKKLKGSNTQEMNIFLRTVAIIMLLFEVYKQFVFTIEGGTWDYQWYIFPFQFCSVPMYVMFISSFLKEGRVKKALYAFLGTYSLFGGLAVMLYPDTVFITTLGISIQTMVHHGSMVLVGFTLLYSGHIVINRKEIIKAASIFFILAGIAFLLNVVFHNVDGTFNMFFIGPYYDTSLPVFTIIENELGYIPFLISYFLGFTLAAYLVLVSAIFIKERHAAINDSKFNVKKA